LKINRTIVFRLVFTDTNWAKVRNFKQNVAKSMFPTFFFSKLSFFVRLSIAFIFTWSSLFLFSGPLACSGEMAEHCLGSSEAEKQ
jgi:hypothetical protein